MSEVFVLDSSAVLCLMQGEEGAGMVRDALPDSCISAVNLSEVVAKMSERGMDGALIREALDPLDLKIISFDADQGLDAGLLRESTRRLGLSLGDRACLSLAHKRDAIALTTDKAWAKLEEGFKVRVLR